jgi:hypothetical protein
MIKDLETSLKSLVDTGAVVAIKAELEAEGTRVDELQRLALLVARGGTDLAVKVGGCEALSDLRIAKEVQARYVVAPMVESDFALSKFLTVIKKVYSHEEIRGTNFAFNLETKTTMNSFDQIATLASGNLNGVVFGRTDYTSSLGMENSKIETTEITTDVMKAAKIAKENELEFTVGGSITKKSVSNLMQIRAIGLNRFETRKVVFNAECLFQPDVYDLIKLALVFELIWLKHKRQESTAISLEDSERISKIENHIN